MNIELIEIMNYQPLRMCSTLTEFKATACDIGYNKMFSKLWDKLKLLRGNFNRKQQHMMYTGKIKYPPVGLRVD